VKLDETNRIAQHRTTLIW